METVAKLEDGQESPVHEVWTEQERRRLTRLCAVLSGDAGAAEDLAQEAMLEAWRIRERLVDPSGGSAWLDAVARNVCHRWRVRRARMLSHELPAEGTADPAAHDHRDDVAELLEREEMATLLDLALGALPSETRSVLVARYVDEQMPREIAARLALSPEAVSMRLVRGRARLREVLETELSEEPLARIWLERHGVAWRHTRLSCPICGQETTRMRRDDRAALIELRCDACDPTGVAAAWRLDNPELASRLRDVRRPSAIVQRMAAWAYDWWPSAISAGHAPCTRCGKDVAVAPYTREGLLDPHTARGWSASCSACGEQLAVSLLSLALALPELRRLRQRRHRSHAVPTREVRYEGRPALLVGVRDERSGDGVHVLFDHLTTRPLTVVPTR